MKVYRTFRGEGDLSHIRLHLGWRYGERHSQEFLVQSLEMCGFEDLMYADLYNEELRIGAFNISPLPGNNLIGVVFSKYLDSKYRGTPVSDFFRKSTRLVAEALNLQAIICTVNKRNAAGLRNAEKSFYREVGEIEDVKIFLNDLKPLPNLNSYE